MAPEQMELGKIDPRADQFAFAVSLWSALFGAPPFSGDTITARRAAIAAGPTVPDVDRQVPSWLVAIVRRALAARPDDRFASMRALIAAVERGRGRRRRIAAGVAAVLAVGTIVPAVWLTRGDAAAAEPCVAGAAEIAKVWTADRADAIAAVFPDGAAGREAAHRLRSRLDGYAGAWALAHRAACRATRVDRSQSEEVLDRRMVCLERARSRLDAVLGSIPRVGRDAIADLAVAVDELPRLGRCADLSALSALLPMPDDPATRARVEAAAARHNAAWVAVQERAHPDHTAETGAALADARAAGWAPLTADAVWTHGTAQFDAGQAAEALATYREAAAAALVGGDDELAARAMADVAWSLAALHRAEEAREWVELARAMAHRAGDIPRLTLDVTTTASEVARQLGRFEEAIAEPRRRSRWRRGLTSARTRSARR